MKKITAQQHAAIVLKSWADASSPRDREYRTFAKPGETQAAAIKRFMAARKRELRMPEKRVFPNTPKALASTKAYVEAYYALNQLGSAQTVADLFGELSTNAPTWPEMDEVVVEHLEQCPACNATI